MSDTTVITPELVTPVEISAPPEVKYTLADLDPLFKIESSINDRLEDARNKVVEVKKELSAHYKIMLNAANCIKADSPHLGGIISQMLAAKDTDTTKKKGGKRGRPAGSKNKKAEEVKPVVPAVG